MMTSVTLPSSSGPIHGVYSSSAAVTDETTSSEPEFEIPRPLKRCLTTSLSDSCKKRRKQSTPVRISAADTPEGKPCASPEPELQCFANNGNEQQQPVECKKEPEEFMASTPSGPTHGDRAETPLELTTTGPRSADIWMNELQNKEWMGPNIHSLPFNPANPMFMALPQFAQPDNMPRQPIRIFNPDAYCDLCNKEFCNKYFLKTHKANKHGIYTDPPSCETLTNSVNIPSFSATAVNMKLATSVPSIEIPTIKSEPQTATSIMNPFSEIFPNPFSSKIFPKLNKANMSGLYESEQSENVPTSNGFSSNSESDKITTDEIPAEDCSSPKNTNIQAESTSIKTEPEVMLYTSLSKMSPGQRELDYSNRLKRFGVMNPKAFCEICCKEYCNKYFLRTHKMKRHGIYIPDDKDKDYKSETSSSFIWPSNTQTSPLNLIMAEQSDRKATSPADISCDICGIRFQNASLAQLHNVSVHSKPFSKRNESADNSLDEPKKTEVPNVNEKPLNAEAISEDLQKLQTMILQLNDLEGNKVPTTCSACNREFENRYFLHAHMMTEHGMLLEDVADIEKPGDAENSSNNNTVCDLCGKDVQSVDEMKKHMMEIHGTQQISSESNKDDYNGFSASDKGTPRVPVSSASMPERRISMSLTPTSSYCEICNKELCNKYFMKTHMQRMHGIEIENGAQIGGVICDICNKELCSKYFLRVHKHNTHGIVEYGTSLLQPRKSESEQSQPAPAEPDTALKPSDLADLSHRYFTHFTEVCTICSRRFRSTKWLKAHLLSDHGQAGAEKWAELEQQLQHTIGQHSKSATQLKTERTSPTLKIPNGGQDSNAKVGIQNVLSSLFGVDDTNVKTYQCSFCPYATPLLPLLFVHERSHAIQSSDGERENVPLKCPMCTQSFLQPELLQHHIFSQHPFLPLPPFFNGSVENHNNEISKEPIETQEEDSKSEDCSSGGVAIETNQKAQQHQQSQQQQGVPVGKAKKAKSKIKCIEVSPDIGESLKDVAKKVQLPATYALPQMGGVGSTSGGGEEGGAAPAQMAGYVMQAFLLEESSAERRVVPAVVFLPVLQKQPSPIQVTFTLTPA